MEFGYSSQIWRPCVELRFGVALAAMWRWLTWLITVLKLKETLNWQLHPLTALQIGPYDSLWEEWRPSWQAQRHHSINTCESEGLP